MRVLVVEDERTLADAIARGCGATGMAVDVAYDGTSGHEMAFVTRYDVVVLDRDLPGVHGDEICADLVGRGHAHPGAHADRERYGGRPGRGAAASAPTTTCPSRSRSTSWSPGSGRSAGARRPVAPPVLTVGDVMLDRPSAR